MTLAAGQLGPGHKRWPARSSLGSSPLLELRGAELKSEHYGLSTSKGWAMVVDGDAPFSALSSEVVRAQWNGYVDNVANYFV